MHPAIAKLLCPHFCSPDSWTDGGSHVGVLTPETVFPALAFADVALRNARNALPHFPTVPLPQILLILSGSNPRAWRILPKALAVTHILLSLSFCDTFMISLGVYVCILIGSLLL